MSLKSIKQFFKKLQIQNDTQNDGKGNTSLVSSVNDLDNKSLLWELIIKEEWGEMSIFFYYLSCMNVFHENQKTGKSSRQSSKQMKK